MQRSYTNSEQEAIQVLMLLMQEKIIPPESWEVMKTTPVKILKQRFEEIVTEERTFFFDSSYYRIKIKLGTDWPKKRPSEKTKSWHFKEAEIKTRPFAFYPWRTQKINFDQFIKIRSCRSYPSSDWVEEAQNHYRVIFSDHQLRPTHEIKD